ncbi:hypothetical protein PsexTeo8_23140 [Pseudomonas extremaustralis]|nr:hypothetical protein [Pseudomonas extremaustralis]
MEVDLPPPKELKSSYDVVIIGAGGHGLATAYYLAKYHGITNIAVLEKSYLGGGNTARNTAVIRSNYLTSDGVRFYAESVKMFQALSNEFDFNIMYSERGQLTLAHTDATVRSFRQRAEVNKHFGGRTEMIDRQQIRELVPSLSTSTPATCRCSPGSGTSTAPPRATMPWPGATPNRRPSAAWKSISSPKCRT